MPQVLEVLFARSTDTYRTDPTVFNDALKYVNAAKGSVGIYYGANIEDGETLVNLVSWEKLEDHHDLMKNPTIYPLTMDAFARAGDPATMEMLHVEFPGNVAAALNAPVTSILHIQSIKPGKTLAELQEHLEALSQVPDAPGSHGGSWGKAIENEAHVMILGWDSVEAHKAYMAQETVASRIRLLINDIIGRFQLRRFKLITYKKLDP